MQQHGDQISPHVESTLLRMNFCRTAALGSRTYRCEPCNYETTVFNSCGDRHCPNCSGAKRRDWMESSSKLIVPGVTYFQVVFTLPEQLSSLALGNRKLMYDLLFKTAWQSLQAKIQNELGIQAAGLAVLHTWNQELGHHPHVHMMVPGNGPSLDGRNWVECRLTKREAKPFLVDNKELGRDFRDLYLADLERVACSGELQLADSGYIADLIGDVRLIDWNVFIEGPPKPECPPERMLKYLTRYLTGGPISDKRIVGEKDGRVWFMARRQDKQPGQRLTSLPNVEFVRRWTMHVLPKEFTKVRQFGHWASTKRSSYLRACAANFEQFQASRSSIADVGAMEVDSIAINSLSEPSSTSINPSSSGSSVSTELLVPAVMAVAAVVISPCKPAMQADLNFSCATTSNSTASSSKTAQLTKEKRCPHCQQALQCIAEQPRPAWRELFYGPEHPWWFEWTSLGQRPPINEQLELSRQTSVAAQPIQASPDQPIAQDNEEHLENLEQPDIFDQIIAQNLAKTGQT
jgi:Putative transposase/Transposase zinc-binding domain